MYLIMDISYDKDGVKTHPKTIVIVYRGVYHNITSGFSENFETY